LCGEVEISRRKICTLKCKKYKKFLRVFWSVLPDELRSVETTRNTAQGSSGDRERGKVEYTLSRSVYNEIGAI
jgi:hypothetical protein